MRGVHSSMGMRKVTYSMGVSVDGYIVGPDGEFKWATPGADMFRFCIDELKKVDVHVMGRKLYETMVYWETADQDPSLDADSREWTKVWKALPKVVFSKTLKDVKGRSRVMTGGLVEEVQRLKNEAGDGEIAIGGATLATELAKAGLIDEYQLQQYPVLVGGGTRFFAHDAQLVKLELVETKRFESSVTFLRYAVKR
ncbi:MAG: dihydrofolate reductase family protein [Archangium sp.]